MSPDLKKRFQVQCCYFLLSKSKTCYCQNFDARCYSGLREFSSSSKKMQQEDAGADADADAFFTFAIFFFWLAPFLSILTWGFVHMHTSISCCMQRI